MRAGSRRRQGGLHVVQSAVSSTVRALERELDTHMFDRTTHRVALTPAGEAFVPAGRATATSSKRCPPTDHPGSNTTRRDGCPA
ncbi:LysR family transcriptional regulator [Streptomyces sp. NPDC047515]|uniref:LysR family transcriptional regulator n=1 Tax=Streptomyces sp. NPDC047515 TaxID=3155380 RepID=UPI00340949F4